MQGSPETYSLRSITFLACFLVKQISRTTGWERSRQIGTPEPRRKWNAEGPTCFPFITCSAPPPNPSSHPLDTNPVCAICSCRRVLPSSCQKQSLLDFALSTFSHNFCPQGLCSLHQILKLWRQSNVGSLPPPLLIIFDFCINLILLSLSFLSCEKSG